ncbi:eukaryotic peptide chain release factor GTP-binding subunit ERF3A-like [Glandiceps talaboti]
MDPKDNQESELDSWDQQEDPGPGDRGDVSALGDDLASASLNVHAAPFVPGTNVNAPAFVPSFSPKSSSESPDAETPTAASTSESSTPTKEEAIKPPDTKEGSTESDAETEVKQAEEDVKENGPKVEEAEQREPEPEPEPEPVPVAKASTKKKEVIKPVTDERPVKEHVNVVFIGHVDAGKSTIGGHIMYLTGGVDKRTLEKYEREAKEKNRESWYLSWALDTNQEERDKGKTVEVGRAYFETDKKHFTILDAPGHRSFVPNMIGGAAQADLAVLVISARKGEFETGFERGGQTREHAMLAKTAGVKHLVVLINKMDDPTVVWEESRFEECKDKLIPFLKKVGFNPKKDVYFIPVSGMTGANLKESAADVCSWYSGPALIPYLDDLPSLSRTSDGPLRLPVIEKYKDMGTILLGKVESGSISKGQSVVLMPNKTTVEVLAVISDEEEVSKALTGENIKCKVKGVEEEDVLSGFVLCESVNTCHTARIFDAQIVIIEYKSIICPGFNAVMHIHSCVEEVQIKSLLALVDRKTGAKSKQKPRFVKPDQIVLARLETSGVICIETFQEFQQMGRFTLRDEGKTIAIGKVLKLVE